MFTPAGRPHDVSVEIRIYVDELTPPAGQVRRVGAGDPVPFSGWLDLIRALERLIGERDDGPAPRRVDR